jgi:mono/diheme cytochrome c family protein
MKQTADAQLTLSLAIAITLLEGSETTSAQNVETGLRLSERWCSECHAIGPAPGKFHRAPSFATIAKETISSDMIASFLLLPHATMPNVPLSRKEARDIAAFIIEMKK